MKIYPAYNREADTASPPSPKPPERWARSAYLESARSAMSALSPGKAISNTNLNSQGQGNQNEATENKQGAEDACHGQTLTRSILERC